nr:HPP family protein [Halochromatium glycolicum]
MAPSRPLQDLHHPRPLTAVARQRRRFGLGQRLACAVVGYLNKMRGSARGAPPRVSTLEVLWSWLGSFLGIALVAWLNEMASNQAGSPALWLEAIGLTPTDGLLLIGSFGASAVLVYGAPRSPLAQPRNLIGGHTLSALVGVSAWLLLGPLLPWLAAALAVSTAIAVMHLTRTLHPPGGATALIAVIGSEQIHALGYLFVLIPATLGPLLMLLVALLVNNLASGRRYPEFWL